MMIVCDSCGAEGDDAYDTRHEVHMRSHRVANHRCRRCGSHELKMIYFEKMVMVTDEWDDENSLILDRG